MTLKQGDRISIEAQVWRVVDPGTGHILVDALIFDPQERGFACRNVRVPIERVALWGEVGSIDRLTKNLEDGDLHYLHCHTD